MPSGFTHAPSPKHAERVACPSCDLLVDLPELEEGQRAHCPRCQHHLALSPRGGVVRPLAFAITGLILFIVANSFPFLSFKASGREQVMNLAQAATELMRHGSPTLACIVLALILIGPALSLACIVFITTPLALGKRFVGIATLSKLVFRIGPWTMADVFMIGVLVSLTKIASLATVVIGLSFWAYAGFALMFVATMASLDRRLLWQRIGDPSK